MDTLYDDKYEKSLQKKIWLMEMHQVSMIDRYERGQDGAEEVNIHNNKIYKPN